MAALSLLVAVAGVTATKAQERMDGGGANIGGYGSYGGYYGSYGNYYGNFATTGTLFSFPVIPSFQQKSDCSGLKRRAQATGSRKWRAQYEACRRES